MLNYKDSPWWIDEWTDEDEKIFQERTKDVVLPEKTLDEKQPEPKQKANKKQNNSVPKGFVMSSYGLMPRCFDLDFYFDKANNTEDRNLKNAWYKIKDYAILTFALYRKAMFELYSNGTIKDIPDFVKAKQDESIYDTLLSYKKLDDLKKEFNDDQVATIPLLENLLDSVDSSLLTKKSHRIITFSGSYNIVKELRNFGIQTAILINELKNDNGKHLKDLIQFKSTFNLETETGLVDTYARAIRENNYIKDNMAKIKSTSATNCLICYTENQKIMKIYENMLEDFNAFNLTKNKETIKQLPSKLAHESSKNILEFYKNISSVENYLGYLTKADKHKVMGMFFDVSHYDPYTTDTTDIFEVGDKNLKKISKLIKNNNIPNSNTVKELIDLENSHSNVLTSLEPYHKHYIDELNYFDSHREEIIYGKN